METINKEIKRYNIPFKLNQLLEFVFWFAIIGSLFVKSFYFQFTSKLNERPYWTPSNIYMMASILGVLLIILGLVLLLSNKKRLIVLLLINVFMSFILFSDTIYFRYYYCALSVSSLHQLGLVGSVTDSITNLLKIKDIVYIIDLPFFLVALILFMKIYKESFNPIPLAKKSITSVILIVIGMLSTNIATQNADTSIFNFDNNYIIKRMGINYYHYFDAKGYIINNFLTDRRLTAKEQDDLQEFFNNKSKSGQDYLGIAKNKNLLIVQVEALQHFVINAKTPNGEEITPNLNKLIKESSYFNNIYYQVGGGNTADAELLSNTSLYPSKEGCAYFLYPTNTYHSLGNILKEQGYANYVFHANNATFWNRNVMYPSLGFDEFYSNKRFELDEYVGWGLGDTSFYRQSLDKIDTNNPFYGFMISLSSHFPFKYPYFENYDFNVGEYEGTFLGYYLKSINYADKALGSLIQDLKDRGLYDNTLLVIYGDHSAVPKDNADQLMKYVGKELSDFEWLKLQKVPLIIHYPGLPKGKVINTTGGEVDILPTIANLMDFEVPYALGKDLLNTNDGYAVLRNSSVITDKYIYISNNSTAYDIETGKLLEPDAYMDEVKALQKQLHISDIILKKNALKNKLPQ